MNKKHVVIVGAGTAGIMLANKLARNDSVMITVIDKATEHYYQPGFLFYPFGKLEFEDIVKPMDGLLQQSVYYLNDEVVAIDASKKSLATTDGTNVSYDVLVIATGTRIDPSLTEGMQSDEWHRTVFDFYTPAGIVALRDALQAFSGGRLVVQIAEMPIKCPVAPLEFSFLSDEYFTKRGIRGRVDITFVTPLSGAFTKPVASEKLGHLLNEKRINQVTDFYAEKIDTQKKQLVCYDGRTVDYDLLVTIPTNVGVPIMQHQDFTDDLGFVDVDPQTLQSKKEPSIFAIGDATNVATSKAGSVAHFEADILTENILAFIDEEPLSGKFDGHSNCFVEVGNGRGLLLDFNYDTQPYEGTFPFAGIGPLSLLKPTRMNHWGKLLFRYIYWYMLLPGRRIPFIPTHMSTRGKKIIQQ